MKLKYAHIENFKGVRKADLNFVPPNETAPQWLHAVLGDNGAGKTTVLQAIALTLSLATRRTRRIEDFRWHGFIPERLSTLGKTRVELVVEFEDDEVRATHEIFDEWQRTAKSNPASRQPFTSPDSLKTVTLVFESGRVDCAEGEAAKFQLLGRYYVKSLSRTRPDLKDYFSRLGDIFWYDQYRNLGDQPQDDLAPDEKAPVEGWSAGVELLRETLVGWWAYHTSRATSNGRDYIKDLQQHFQQLYPGTQFQGVAPMENARGHGAADFYFILNRDSRPFDISEMSSGEQAIFPLICDFVRLGISRSIVMIDELELHLHPPEQQGLLAYLPKLGSDCQFIITTHSEYVAGCLPKEQETRLPGGRLCL